MRRAAKVDTNHSEIAGAFRKCGVRVLDLSRMGQGVPDLLVLLRKGMRFAEVKSAKGKLTPQQVEFTQHWPVDVVRDVSDVERIVNADRLTDYPSNNRDELPDE